MVIENGWSHARPVNALICSKLHTGHALIGRMQVAEDSFSQQATNNNALVH